MQETLKEILIELKSINKKLDALTPSLNVNEIVDRLTETVQNELLQTTIHDTSKKEIDYLREVAEKEVISAFQKNDSQSIEVTDGEKEIIDALIGLKRNYKTGSLLTELSFKGLDKKFSFIKTSLIVLSITQLIMGISLILNAIFK